MFTVNPFRNTLLVALGLPSLALATLPITSPQQRVPIQPGPAAQVGQGAAPSPGDIEKMLVIAAAARVPAGSILPFAGETPPPGYLLCDGTELLRDDFPALFAAVGSSWGSATAFTFTLPELRGRFLRGVDGAAGNDPDSNTRGENAPGGHTGNNVGSVQEDGREGVSGTVAGTTSSNGTHTHGIETWQDDWDEDDGSTLEREGWADDSTTGADVRHFTEPDGGHTHSFSVQATFPGDAETRPKNAYVNFIIKV